MKKFLAILGLVAVIAAVLLLSRSKSPPAVPSASSNEKVSETVSSTPSVQTKTQSLPSVAAPGVPSPIVNSQTDLASRAASPNPPPTESIKTNSLSALPPLTVLDKARVVIHNYHAAFGENPVGTNPEIAAMLQGKNPRQINFLAESGLRLNGKGEIIDGYGTPFFFHQLSAHEMEIRSAGPDKILWTADDLVTR